MGKNINDQKSVSGIVTGVALQVPGAALLAEAGESEPGDEDISALEPEALVAAWDVPARAKQAAAEVTKRLESTPKANRFAYRVLRRVCFKAIGSLYAPGDQPPLIYVREIERWVTTDRKNSAIFWLKPSLGFTGTNGCGLSDNLPVHRLLEFVKALGAYPVLSIHGDVAFREGFRACCFHKLRGASLTVVVIP